MTPDPNDLLLIFGVCLFGAGLILTVDLILGAVSARRDIFTCPKCHSQLERRDLP